MPKGHRISIIGAGIAGLTLGRCLQNKGIQSTIFEKARQSTSRNSYGITLHSKFYQPLLKVLDLDETAFRKRIAVDAGIGGTGRVSGGKDAAPDSRSFKANKNLFEALLAEGLEVKWEHELTSVEPLPGAVELDFKNHNRHASTFVIGADGPHSQVRRTILPNADFTILPYATYNGKRRISRADWDREFAPAFNGGAVVEQKINGTLLQISLNSINDEEASVNYVFSRAAKRSGEGDALFRPKREKTEAKDTPEELFTEVQALSNQLSGPFATIFHSDAMKKDRLLNWLMRSLPINTSNLTKQAEEGIVLIGDAVHAEPILGPGLGANESIEDAIALAEVLDAGKEVKLNKLYDRRGQAWQTGIQEAERRIAEVHGVSSGGKASL
ncbi:Putative FAD-binding domain, FAD/NAD(P)-binding domain superfamily [Septoria linicola]|uniref:FAD-binding domain, FAD/NAD(P)-binding domain superfamily n=1 Tax=Septoria linicola TaxID=215465 RepID=A0A9Q9API3_9PEZI|nr:putative FAD-binding domain, FAD/NAD(P)-binding domain superfamily [Septoria linicola]USW53332.1 Putative FAD-binding domain, FAD/NAD(P)-binding domain superfamily [Septoria linicola]